MVSIDCARQNGSPRGINQFSSPPVLSRFELPLAGGRTVDCHEKSVTPDWADHEKSPLNDDYRSCLYVELKCQQCGCWRMCIEPESQVACPKCASTTCTRTVLANGLTRRELPIVELYLAPRDPSERRIKQHLRASTPYYAETWRRATERRNIDDQSFSVEE